MRILPSSFIIGCAFLFSLLSAAAISALTLDDLRQNPKMTPEEFGAAFKGFEFKFHAEVQPVGVFLASKSGDCDDYAILASTILKEKGYTPRLIAIRMRGIVHVVCYVQETHSYLDYNLRNAKAVTVPSGADVSEIAEKVARSYHLSWNSASEFTWSAGTKRLVATNLGPAKHPAQTGKSGILAGLFER